MKTYKLIHHSKPTNNSKDAPEILLNSKDFPNITLGDVVEVYHPDGDHSRLLLKVKQFKEDQSQKETVSIEQSIACSFHLRTYSDVHVNKVNPLDNVSLDLVELLFKDQYFSRSDMYRMWKSLIGDCVYLNKKVEFKEMRAEAIELWSQGEKVACGIISEKTRVVYRSSTAVVQIFIQMSCEMWDFDISGDLYFEKAVNGFLTDLFLKWKEQNCCHDVTIVLFSRTFYSVQSIEEFPEYLRDCLQVDYKGRIYEDFYRVVVQNERYMYEEWSSILQDLRILFNKYDDRVLNYHRKNRKHIPKAYNSTAAQGNFLETLNMSLNLFENYYIDRNFDRTGKVSVVITPGPGVFEVDRELTNITKQRTIDCGVGSDLVCMGEQPLHAAPLFKFHSKDAQTAKEIGDDYNIPHWMNHSFYISKNQIENFKNLSFIPRIKPPQEYLDLLAENPKGKACRTPSNFGDDDDNFPFMDYDEYDAQVFKLLSRNNPRTLYEVDENQGKSSSFYHGNRQRQKTRRLADARQNRPAGSRTRYRSDDFEGIYEYEKSAKNIKSVPTSSPAICIPPGSLSEDFASSMGCYPIVERGLSRGSVESSDSEEYYMSRRAVVGSAGSPIGHSRRCMENYRPRRALINPFAPSRMHLKMTSNMRRWVHAFPKDPKGSSIQPHIMRGNLSYDGEEENAWTTPTKEVLQGAQRAVEARRQRSVSRQGSIDHDLLGSQNGNDSLSGVNLSPNHSHYSSDVLSSSFTNTSNLDPGNRYRGGKREKLFLEPRNVADQEWQPEMTTGWDWRALDKQEEMTAVSHLMKPILTADLQCSNFYTGISVDWKSLTTPASLPITTDFFPDSHSLHYDYVVSDYNLLPDDINSDYWIKSMSSEDEKFYRQEPMTTNRVFKELVNQRLAEGFQLIIFNSSKIVSVKDSALGSSPQYHHTSSLIRARPRHEQQEEYYLSIGRIFHKLTLCGSTITVTRYRPRHSQPQHHYNYQYRFQCPDSYRYDVSWTEFSNEKLENYNWNYLDLYICTRGEGDYDLLESLKFWRSRYFLIPCNNSATKKIIDGHSRGDIYEEKTPAELKQSVSGFLRFLEVTNKIKRSTQSRKSRVAPPDILVTPDSSPNKPENDKQSTKDDRNSSSAKLIEAMLDTNSGIGFLPKQPGIPEKCFLSAEASLWCVQNVQGIETLHQANQLIQRLMDEQLIIHASGNPRHKYIYGFYMYMILPPSSKQKTPDTELPYNLFFQNEFCEVGIKHEAEEIQTPEMKKFYLRESDRTYSEDSEAADWRILSGISVSERGQHIGKVNLCATKATKHYKFVNVDVDPSRKSERLEWATACYHAYYRPDSAFELQVQWMVATGCILSELVYSWTRKASSCGFHLLPVPVDPFALPNSSNSDPLRGPVFVPLQLECLTDSDSEIFNDYPERERQDRLLQFQQIIIKRYGFLPAGVYGAGSDTEFKQYVHCTGGMFVIIPDYTLLSPKNIKTSYSSGFGKKSSTDMCKDYIARQGEPEQQKSETGFLWSWNFMLSKRWKSTNTGDEHFQNKMLADFRKFCSNSENRLVEFWEEYKTDM